ncbi:SDR family oxidoreductase [Streptomyces rochei]|uniref:SDR family oxidoreductase n=1 Tax=Streptomyces rochei TaxID=1928 RepID=UPI003466015E
MSRWGVVAPAPRAAGRGPCRATRIPVRAGDKPVHLVYRGPQRRGIIGPHYAASKAALHGLTHSLAPGVAAAGVTVNAPAPALVGGTRILPADAAEGGKLPAPIPVGRLGPPDEVATMAASMVTNGYLTNKVITLDGGLYPR